MSKKNALTIPGRYAQIKDVVEFVADGANEAGLDEDTVFHIELCCDEACTNIIEHAYGGEGKGEIVACYEVDEDTFRITIHDNGRIFNPEEVPSPPSLSEPLPADETVNQFIDQLKVGGLGIHFMRELMDEIQFSFDPQHGNTLVMVKKLPKRSVK